MIRNAVLGLVVSAMLLTPAALRAEEPVRDGAPITPELAKRLFDGITQLHESDGCRLTRFDTSRYRIAIGIAAAGGTTEYTFDLATAPGLLPVPRRVGDWSVGVPPELARDCPATVAAVERMLASTASEEHVEVPWRLMLPTHYGLLAFSFVLLVIGTAYVLVRETLRQRPPPAAMLALLAIWAVALALRLTVSPRTFLHEYYHIAETVPAYLSGEMTGGYGKTGPALFRLAALLFGVPDDLRVIFLTNAVISSLAVPAAALLVLTVLRSWPQALCAAALLAVLPQHLRFSAAEDLFVQAVTFGMWSLGLFALYARTRRLDDALLAALAISLATQTRPEMIFFPGVAVTLLLCTEPGSWRLLFHWRTLLAGAVLAGLLIPHALDVQRAISDNRSPGARPFSLRRYLETLVFFQPQITPLIYRVAVAAGAIWAAMRRPGWLLWIGAIYVGYTIFALSIFDNPPYHLRSQILPTSFLVLLGGGLAPAWMALWSSRTRSGAAAGVALLALVGALVVFGWRGFVTQLKDQQLEWAFLERAVPELPERATLVAAVDAGGPNLDAFPTFLLQRSGRRYALVDVRRAARGEVEWPAPADELIYYQGMFCYFAFDPDTSPDPMMPVCQAVYDRYDVEPLVFEDLHTQGYSALRYAQGGDGVYRIGFYRLKPKT